ncbi:nitrogenase iron-molybdenum cofactor biosynthesis protein NifN [Rhodoferax sp. 4810]|uniref:Nitrogenase iron-molybdenum cofactor biosynthesis protein NifN n=1 Tax=Thiospirillum jenense TaxID=1653858 RepID=A0A839HCW4_9GAMM|nr:nitrogenase iron-molybdenum cofactor biosynthesis protein NifN [Thiospirillum jenense]MBB1075114.1 nitrogenase iron-molybdenum cofactor biosynthesis protein NifN [Rhodoferax jenense]MBB1126763.1 nitrogenase iron-molybdenum cofactor biosynthesis protein NifN [Thiospirillum jenense]
MNHNQFTPPTIIKRNKALSVSPLKASAPLGAALACLGFNRAIPMLHGSQGCTAFGKIFFIQHFREAIPLQTTALDQVSAIMGSDENVIEGVRTLCAKHQPALIGIPTTGLVETQGADVRRAVREFRRRHPEFADVAVVPIASPDYVGSLETGYATAVQTLLAELVPEASAAGTRPGRRQRQINVLVGAHLTPGDLEYIKDTLERFRLRPVIIPDIGDALDGHLADSDYSALTIGGTLIEELMTLGDAAATLVIGGSMAGAADVLRERTGVSDYRFNHLMGLDAVDQFIATLTSISAEPVPAIIERQRSQLQDAMLDTHFALGGSRVAIAAEADLLIAFSELVASVGGSTVAAVAPTNSARLRQVRAEQVQIGDLEDLEQRARAAEADLLLCNSHGVHSANRLGIPLLRIGFPQFDLIGGYQRCWSGYAGTRQALFDLANLMLQLEKGEIHPYHSPLKQMAGAGVH